MCTPQSSHLWMTASGKVKGTIKIRHRRIFSNAVLVVSKLSCS
jgi:hypothetical protein